MKELIMNVLVNLIQLAILGGLGTLINYLYKKTSSEKVKELYNYAKIVVRAMEGTIIEKGSGEKKKQEAIRLLSQKTKGKISEDELALLVQSAFEETIKVLKVKGLEK